MGRGFLAQTKIKNQKETEMKFTNDRPITRLTTSDAQGNFTHTVVLSKEDHKEAIKVASRRLTFIGEDDINIRYSDLGIKINWQLYWRELYGVDYLG